MCSPTREWRCSGKLADLTGLTAQVSDVLADTYRGPWRHDPGRVFTDRAAAVAYDADRGSGIGGLADRRDQHAPVASVTTAWRLLTRRVDAGRLPGLHAARSRAWEVGAAPTGGDGWLHVDIDATITIDHSDRKENAAATWKRTFGFHPLLAFLDRPDIAAGEASAGILRPGNAGSNTTADHIAAQKRRPRNCTSRHSFPCSSRAFRWIPSTEQYPKSTVDRSRSANALVPPCHCWVNRMIDDADNPAPEPKTAPTPERNHPRTTRVDTAAATAGTLVNSQCRGYGALRRPTP